MLPQRLLIVGGKGGVGRTTIAAALGVALARQGRRTLLAHVRCGQQLNALLGGKEEIGDDIAFVEPNLWAVNMNPKAAIREMGLLTLRFRAVYRMVLENRIIRSFLHAVPALEEYSMVGKAWFHTTETLKGGSPRYETVVFDGPATGHLISMLRIPQVILDSVPEGPLTTDARKARALLADPARAAMWLVTLAEEMPVSEALDLYRATTEELGISLGRVVVNALYPEDLAQSACLEQALATVDQHELSTELADLVACTATFRARRQINEQQLRQLERSLPVDRIELPHLFVPTVGRAQIDELADRITRALTETQP